MQAVSATGHETARMVQDQMQEQKTIFTIYVSTPTRHPKTTLSDSNGTPCHTPAATLTKRQLMKHCSHCGNPLPDDAQYCGRCGQRQPARKPVGEAFIDHLNDYVGNDKPADLNWRMLFTDVFKSHSVEEAEDIFICGTHKTTPHITQVSKEWPRPWLYSRVFVMFTVAFVLLWLCCNMFRNPNTLPGMIVVGSFAVPLSTMILFLEVNAWRNVSLYKVIQTFLVGGCASLVATLLLFSIVGSHKLDFFGAALTGFVEETGKAVIVYHFLKRTTGRLSILSGLLIGASVGAGFAAFESAGYAMSPVLAFFQNSGYYAAYGRQLDISVMLDAINQSIVLRGFLAPGGHVTWAAISGAGMVIAAKALRRLDTSVLTDARFLRLFAIPVVLHATWDSPLTAIGQDILLVPLALTAIVWIVVLILINMGLAEVEQAERAYFRRHAQLT